MQGLETIVKLHFERDDVDAHSKNIGGVTLLSHAAMNGYEAIVKLLIKGGDVKAGS
jgi:ankyrin repeat protein